MIVITPSRPLWPSRTVLSRIDGNSPAILQRAKTGYSVYAGRSDGLGPVRDALPPDAAVIGYLSYSSSAELPLWKPYMKRRLRHMLPQDNIDMLRVEGIRYVVLNTENFEARRSISPEEWVRANGGIIRSRIALQLLARFAPTEWWIVEFSTS